MDKKVIKFKGKEKSEEMCKPNPIKLEVASKYVEPYWWEIIRDVFSYEKERNAGLQEIHKIFTDDRILKGLELYKNGGIKEGAVTDVDVRATVNGDEKEYMVTLKNWKPEKLLRHRYEIERYISELFIDCQCQDHGIHHYKSNSSLACKHICGVIWILQEEYNMPKFFLTPKEEKDDWYEKSKTLELETGIYGVSMKQFSQFLNILVLRDFRGIPTSLAYSIHKEPNKGYESKYPNKIPPVWITFDSPEAVEKLIKANIKGYAEMLASRGNTTEDIKKAVDDLIPTKKEKIKEEIKENWFKKLIRKLKRE